MRWIRYVVLVTLGVIVSTVCLIFFSGNVIEIPAEGNNAVNESTSASAPDSEDAALEQALQNELSKREVLREQSKKEEEKRKKAEEEKKKKEEEEKLKKLLQLPDTGHYVDPEWFNDAVFVGDSLTVMLSLYAEGGELGDADFVCASSLGYNNALWDLKQPGNVHPLYKGKKVTAFDGVKQSGRKKVFIMLGMNDIGVYGVDGAIDGLKEFTKRMLEKNPDVKLYFQSVTPMLKNKQRDDLNNKNIPEFDKKLKSFCDENNFRYINITPAVWDGKGNLLYENCGDPDDMGLHPSMTGCSKWVDCLRRYVETDKELAEEASRLAEESRLKEESRLAEESRILEESRLAEEERQKETTEAHEKADDISDESSEHSVPPEDVIEITVPEDEKTEERDS